MTLTVPRNWEVRGSEQSSWTGDQQDAKMWVEVGEEINNKALATEGIESKDHDHAQNWQG